MTDTTQPVAIVRDADGNEITSVPVEPMPRQVLDDGSVMQAGWQIAPELAGTFEVQNGWSIQFPPFADGTAAVLDPAAVRAVVHEELASIGGHMLAAYGDNPDPKARTLAAVGGYLLGRFGDGDPTEQETT